MDQTCNSTLEELRISPGSEVVIIWSLTFHDLACVVAATSTLLAVVVTLYLIWMHALNYTHPHEQRYIIRILFLVPIYGISSFMQIQWYWHAIYFKLVSDCYEAFAIASFFALLCSYVAPELHTQKVFFREMRPIKAWVAPVSLFAKCCGGQRGPWRTPKSGLVWFNIVWTGIYNYCFVRVSTTIAAVILQHFRRYCESSTSHVFGHIWIISINGMAVCIAMICLIQFYVQLKERLAERNILIKILALKLVVFLSFWQVTALSIGTSTFLHPNDVIAYPDLKTGVPALLLCIEMVIFATLYLWAFPYAPYMAGAPTILYPSPDPDKSYPTRVNESLPPRGGFLGLRAILDAINIWDVVKDFCRGMRWLLCGTRRRKEDASQGDTMDMATLPRGKGSASAYDAAERGQQDTSVKPDDGSKDVAGLVEKAQADPEGSICSPLSPVLSDGNLTSHDSVQKQDKA